VGEGISDLDRERGQGNGAEAEVSDCRRKSNFGRLKGGRVGEVCSAVAVLDVLVVGKLVPARLLWLLKDIDGVVSSYNNATNMRYGK
jgi:hypothetical protein